MTGLDKIIDRIREDALVECGKQEDEAKTQIAAIRRESAEVIARMKTITGAQTERETKSILSRGVSTGAMARRNEILDAKSRMLTRCYEEAVSQILAYSSAEYTAFLCGLLTKAVRERMAEKKEIARLYGEAEAEQRCAYEVIFNEKDRAQYGKAVLDTVKPKVGCPTLTLSEKTVKIDGGLILKCGDVETNCSVSLLVEGLHESCDAKIVNFLFHVTD